MFEKTKIGKKQIEHQDIKKREHWENSWENGMLGHSQRAGERKRGEFCLANYFLLLLRSQRLYWRCCCSAGGFAGDEKPSPATGSCKSPAFSSFSYFPKIISNNLTLADNPKLQKKSTNSVFIKKPHQRNSTLSLSIAGEN